MKEIYYAICLVAGFTLTVLAGETNTSIPSIFHQYDNAVLNKITDHWFKALDSVRFANSPPYGKVAVEFHLFPDGHISDLKVDSSTVEENRVALCKMAILDSIPFAIWTKENTPSIYQRVSRYSLYLLLYC